MYEAQFPGVRDQGEVLDQKYVGSGKTDQKSRIGVICNCESEMSGVII